MAHHPLAILAQQRAQRGAAPPPSPKLQNESGEVATGRVFFKVFPLAVGAAVFAYGRSEKRSDLASGTAAVASAIMTKGALVTWGFTGSPAAGLAVGAVGVGIPVALLEK
jgi:hypothetical protein